MCEERGELFERVSTGGFSKQVEKSTVSPLPSEVCGDDGMAECERFVRAAAPRELRGAATDSGMSGLRVDHNAGHCL